MPANRYIPGAWNIICDSCGLKKKSYQVRKRWDGLIVCSDTCWETDHPQKYLRVSEDTQSVPFTRPDTTVYRDVCDLWSSSPMADFGSAGCMTADGNTSIPILIQLFEPTCIAGIAIAGRSIPGVI